MYHQAKKKKKTLKQLPQVYLQAKEGYKKGFQITTKCTFKKTKE